MVTALAGEGLNKGVIKYLSEKDLDKKNRVYFFWVGIVLNIFIFLIACILGILNYKDFAFKFTGDFSMNSWAVLVALPLLANLLNLFLIAVIQSQQKFQLFSFLNTLNILLSAILIYLSIDYQDITISLIAYGIGQGITLLITLPVAWQTLRFFKIPIFSFHDFSKELFVSKLRKMSDFMAIGLSIVIFSRFGVYVLREYNIATFGMAQTGLWEAVMRLSEGYTFAFNATFLVIFYPKVASLIDLRPQLQAYLRKTFLALLPLVALALLTIFLLKEQFIILLFDTSFLPALVFVGWLVVGDFFKIISYLLSNVLIAQGRTWLFVSLQGIFFSQFFLLIYFLTPALGVLALAVSWLVSYLLAVIVLSVILRKIIQ